MSKHEQDHDQHDENREEDDAETLRAKPMGMRFNALEVIWAQVRRMVR